MSEAISKSVTIAEQDVCRRLGVEEFSSTVLVKALKRVPELSEAGPWIAGGAVRNTLQGASLDSDWDFFFADEAQCSKFEDELIGMGASLLTKTEMNSTYILPTVIPEGTEGDGVYLPEMKIQVIKFKYYKNAEEVIESFDFTLCQFAYDGKNITVSPFALWDVARKKLVPAQLSYAASSLRRMIKYARQGYTICGGGLADLLEQVVANPTIIHADIKYID
jgi:RNAse (barnase) inhibitor barstar